MLLQQYYLGCLAHASYLIGDEATGTTVVVDPQRDIDQYLADAAVLISWPPVESMPQNSLACSMTPCIIHALVGEVRSRIYGRDVEDAVRRTSRLAPQLLGTPMTVLFGFVIHPSARETAQRLGAVIISSSGR